MISTRKLNIIVPYHDAERETPIWAEEEMKIDFRRDIYKASRCTTAFAAMELKRYLIRTLSDVTISFLSCKPDSGFFIVLQIIDLSSKNEKFSLAPCRDGILITGQGRTGLLYGAYEFLRMQGWRWYAPGETGEIATELTDELVIPESIMEYRPLMDLGRGFDIEGVSRESAELWMWMARNRLNLATYRPATGPLCMKLGMLFKVGGHIFEEILIPDRIMPSGRTLWEEHENWYGLPADGIRKKDKALFTQFCVSQPDLMEFLAEELLNYLNGLWKEADRIDVWLFDTWGSTCTCPSCRSLGNSTDQMLFFLSGLRSYMDKARSDGRLDHDVQFVMCSYEGTSTITVPLNPFPKNLIDAGDYVVFYPIKRCYAHDFTDSTCSINVLYNEALKSWFNHTPSMQVMVGEYYNVSKFEDLPLLFTSRISNDIPAWYSTKVRGMTYMHIPIVNWGMRTLTQLLYAQLAWDIKTDVKSFLNEYFTNWYGLYAEEMRKVYELIEEAWLFIANWRAWGMNSILSLLQAWDGAKPDEPLPFDNHFVTPAGAVESGRRSAVLMYEAMQILNDVRARNRQLTAQNTDISTDIAINPVEARKLENKQKKSILYEMRLGEDRRLLIYGIDTMTIMTELVAYHDALCREDQLEAESAWQKVEQAAESLDSYFVPIGFEYLTAGLISKDGLTRSQVRDLLRRCRKYRSKLL